MASMRPVFLMIIIVVIKLHHVQSQFSVLATGQVQIIKLLEEITITSTPLVPNITALLTNQEALLENTTTVLNEIKSGQVQMIKRMEDMTSATANHETLLQNSTIVLNEMNSAIHKIADTQTRMAKSLEQIVTLLQSRQSEDVSMLQITETIPTVEPTTKPEIIPTDITIQAGQITEAIPSTTVEPSTQAEITRTDHPIQAGQTTEAIPSHTVEPSTQAEITPMDCSDILVADDQGSGVYTIDPRDGQGSFEVYCNMDIDDGGWTVFQKRFDGSVDFFLNWNDYKDGFGNLNGEHWLGLQQMHRLTSNGRWTLQIDLEDFNGNVGYAQYEDFAIGGVASFYQLSVGSFTGNTSDSLTYHSGQAFTTKDRDHDTNPWNCAAYHSAAWWFASCFQSSLNGLHQSVYRDAASLMSWYDFLGAGTGFIPIKKSEMKIRIIQ